MLICHKSSLPAVGFNIRRFLFDALFTMGSRDKHHLTRECLLTSYDHYWFFALPAGLLIESCGPIGKLTNLPLPSHYKIWKFSNFLLPPHFVPFLSSMSLSKFLLPTNGYLTRLTLYFQNWRFLHLQIFFFFP